MKNHIKNQPLTTTPNNGKKKQPQRRREHAPQPRT